MRLFFDHTGPLMRYGNGVLHVADLNPELEANWRLTRWEMFKLGVRAIVASVLS